MIIKTWWSITLCGRSLTASTRTYSCDVEIIHILPRGKKLLFCCYNQSRSLVYSYSKSVVCSTFFNITFVELMFEHTLQSIIAL